MPRKPHFHILGVPTRLRPIAALPGLLMATLIYTLARRLAREYAGAAAGSDGRATWYEADLIHVTGHIASSQLVDAPMDYVRWGFFATNGYTQHDVTPQQHIGRSLGEPDRIGASGDRLLAGLAGARPHAPRSNRADRFYPEHDYRARQPVTTVSFRRLRDLRKLAKTLISNA